MTPQDQMEVVFFFLFSYLIKKALTWLVWRAHLYRYLEKKKKGQHQHLRHTQKRSSRALSHPLREGIIAAEGMPFVHQEQAPTREPSPGLTF